MPIYHKLVRDFIPEINANGDTVFERCCIAIRFLLIQANGGGGQCVLILYGDQADTEDKVQ